MKKFKSLALVLVMAVALVPVMMLAGCSNRNNPPPPPPPSTTPADGLWQLTERFSDLYSGLLNAFAEMTANSTADMLVSFIAVDWGTGQPRTMEQIRELVATAYHYPDLTEVVNREFDTVDEMLAAIHAYYVAYIMANSDALVGDDLMEIIVLGDEMFMMLGLEINTLMRLFLYRAINQEVLDSLPITAGGFVRFGFEVRNGVVYVSGAEDFDLDIPLFELGNDEYLTINPADLIKMTYRSGIIRLQLTPGVELLDEIIGVFFAELAYELGLPSEIEAPSFTTIPLFIEMVRLLFPSAIPAEIDAVLDLVLEVINFETGTITIAEFEQVA